MSKELTQFEKTELLRIVTEAVQRNVLNSEDRLAIFLICSEAVNRRMRELMIEINTKGEEKE